MNMALRRMKLLLLPFIALCCPVGANRADLTATLAKHGVAFFPNAFSREECELLIQQFVDNCEVNEDYRNDKGVRRINRLDKDGAMRFSGELDWIYTRVLEKAKKSPAESPWGFDVNSLNAMQFRDHVEFDLMHEFVQGYFFDFHVDTKPNDGTMRTINVNVMLSARDAYQGGTLQVGAVNVTAEQGDMYFYPAAYPHKVHDVEGGRRHTYIIAATAKNAGEDGAAVADDAKRREQYFADAMANHEALAIGYAAKEAEPPMAAKLLWLHAEFLDAGGDPDAADTMFAQSYAATGQGEEYSAHFYNQGLAAIQAGYVEEGKKTLQMAVRVDPGNDLAKKALASVGGSPGDNFDAPS